MTTHAFRSLTDLTPDAVRDQTQTLLGHLGETRATSAAYETAWVARLAADFPNSEFAAALDWLRAHQHPDGSWGGSIVYYHDRVICTLAALLALRTAGDDGDRERIQHGQHYLWKHQGHLNCDVGDTIAFPLLVVALSREARALGLDVPGTVSRNVAVIEKKLNLLGMDPSRWRYTSLSFSLEAVPPYLPDPQLFASTDFILGNGSIGTSPSATAAYLVVTKQHDARLFSYLQDAFHHQGDGGMPPFMPAELFEIGWSMHWLHAADLLDADDPLVRRCLDRLWDSWLPSSGISSSEHFPVPDLDDTATAFALLRWGGYPVHADVFKYYEAETHFKCYPGEADPSISVNVRTLNALQTETDHALFDTWQDRILKMLRHYALDQPIWFDKWHISPYYLTHFSITALYGIADDLLVNRVKWIVKTQNDDGGWGYFGASTAEETAHCLHALLFWHEHVESIAPDVLDAGARFLLDRYPVYDLCEQFYVIKCMTMPYHVAQATVLAALYRYARYRGGI